MVGDEGQRESGCATGGGEFTPQSRLLTPSVGLSSNVFVHITYKCQPGLLQAV
jgi:hypothetical protein